MIDIDILHRRTKERLLTDQIYGTSRFRKIFGMHEEIEAAVEVGVRRDFMLRHYIWATMFRGMIRPSHWSIG